MDGVLCDWKQAVRNLGPEAEAGLAENALEKDKQAMYKLIEKAGYDFWANMAWLPDGRELWDWLVTKNLRPVILSSPGKFYWAESGKAAWLNNNIPGVQYFFEENKFIFAERNAILIDDMKENVVAWEHESGLGVLHTSTESTIQKMTEIVNKIFPQSGFKAISSVLREIAEKSV